MTHKKQWSYWEERGLKKDIDLIVVGGGFTGISAAIRAKELNPAWKILVLERDKIAEGASTKNAGFACYGSVGEFLADEKEMGRDKALELILKRKKGLDFLREKFSSSDMEFSQLGGTELFLKGEEEAWEEARTAREGINKDLGKQLFEEGDKDHRFLNTIGTIHTREEGSLNPFKLLMSLRKKAVLLDIILLQGLEVLGHQSLASSVQVYTREGDWKCQRILYCTNAFGIKGKQLDLVPARNQVLLLAHPNYRLDHGTYHQNAGYLYFRGLADGILLGGARHISHREEITEELAENKKITEFLLNFARHVFQEDTDWKIINNWSGIIATGSSKEPIVQEIEGGVYSCLRFGGMGVALSTYTAFSAAERFFKR